MLFVIGADAPREMIDAARKRGAEPVVLPPYPALSLPVRAHADLLINPLCGTLYTPAEYYRKVPGAAEAIDLICRRSGLKPGFIDTPLGCKYPSDVPLCAKRVGNHFIANPVTAPALFESAVRAGLHAVAVKQGYAACSAAAVGGNAIITADAGVARIADTEGLEVLKIQPGHIELPGCRCGFIGGASGFCAERGEVWFCGDPAEHPDGDMILSFICERGAEPVALAPQRLFDCGGIFFF